MTDTLPSSIELFFKLHCFYLAQKEVSINLNGGLYYQRGQSYGVKKKLSVAARNIDARDKCSGSRTSINVIARESGLGWH